MLEPNWLEGDEFGDITEAIACEKEIKKKMTRARKITLIERSLPSQRDEPAIEGLERGVEGAGSGIPRSLAPCASPTGE